MKLIGLSVLITALISCGQSSNPHRHFEKQQLDSDIAINLFDLEKQQLKIRFEYRSYVPKTINFIDCELNIGNNIVFKLVQEPNIKFESFATEVLTFTNLDKALISKLTNSKTISYNIKCMATYNKGKEYLQKDSILSLVPSSNNIFR